MVNVIWFDEFSSLGGRGDFFPFFFLLSLSPSARAFVQSPARTVGKLGKVKLFSLAV